MIFLTNNFIWAAGTVAELYRYRWQIEVFFKQIKQTLQLADFLGNSATPCAGRSGRRCWCMCCSATRRFCRGGQAALCAVTCVRAAAVV